MDVAVPRDMHQKIHDIWWQKPRKTHGFLMFSLRGSFKPPWLRWFFPEIPCFSQAGGRGRHGDGGGRDHQRRYWPGLCEPRGSHGDL